MILAAWALVLPVRGVHRRITSAKEAKLVWSRERIRRARAALEGSPADAERGELADLVAYQALVGRVQEWPFDTSTYVRFALYLLLPLGSWAAGGLIEGLVQALLF